MIQKHPRRKSSQSGFTLVELSIVLVIIGLIVGGVLAGQTLIVAAKIRAQMTQLDQFDAGINAFRGKYDCLPGDCQAAQAPVDSTGASTKATSSAGTIGDGTIDFQLASGVGDESTVAWHQMQIAGVVGGSFTPTAAGANFTDSFPAGKAGGSVVLGGTGGTHYYMLGTVKNATPTTFVASISANTAAAIDKKRDDGLPLTGVVLAYGLAAGGVTPVNVNPYTTTNGYVGIDGNNTDCATATTPNYQSGKDAALCLLRIRISG